MIDNAQNKNKIFKNISVSKEVGRKKNNFFKYISQTSHKVKQNQIF